MFDDTFEFDFIIRAQKTNSEMCPDQAVPSGFAKRLLDYGVHAPTTYFPMLIPECFLIEPTETETLEELDAFVNILQAIQQEAQSDPDMLLSAPDLIRVPDSTVDLDAGDGRKLLKLLDAFEENEDVQSVTSNFNISEEVMQAVLEEAG